MATVMVRSYNSYMMLPQCTIFICLKAPGNSLTKYLLTRDNYDVWTKAIINALKGRNKYGFTNGNFVKSVDESQPNLRLGNLITQLEIHGFSIVSISAYNLVLFLIILLRICGLTSKNTTLLLMALGLIN